MIKSHWKYPVINSQKNQQDRVKLVDCTSFGCSRLLSSMLARWTRSSKATMAFGVSKSSFKAVSTRWRHNSKLQKQKQCKSHNVVIFVSPLWQISDSQSTYCFGIWQLLKKKDLCKLPLLGTCINLKKISLNNNKQNLYFTVVMDVTWNAIWRN